MLKDMALALAALEGLEREVNQEIQNGASPEEALDIWGIDYSL